MKTTIKLLIAGVLLSQACGRPPHLRLTDEEKAELANQEVSDAYDQGFGDGVDSVPACEPEVASCPEAPEPVVCEECEVCEEPTTCHVPVDGDFKIVTHHRHTRNQPHECRPPQQFWFKNGTFKFEKGLPCEYHADWVSEDGCEWHVAATCESGRTYKFKGHLLGSEDHEVFVGKLGIYDPTCHGGEACYAEYHTSISRYYFSDPDEAPDS